MKKLLLSATLATLTLIGFGQDLTCTVVNTATGMNTGSIDLNVSGGVGPYAYSWSGPSGFVANTEDIAGLEYGNYTLTVTDNYCGIAVITVFVDNDVASNVDENEGNEIGIFPNPANRQVTLTSGKVLDGATLKLTDLRGQTVIQKESINGNSFLFDASELPSGIYFIEIYNPGTVSRTRFVKN